MEPISLSDAPYGYDVYTHTEVVPKPVPIIARWYIGPIRPKALVATQSTAPRPFVSSEVTMQLTADQQVGLSISGEDRYGNSVDISGNVAWFSSDDTIVQVVTDDGDLTKATAVAVGPVGTASVTVTNDVDQDGSGDFQGSLAIDVVAGDVSEIVITADEPTDKP